MKKIIALLLAVVMCMSLTAFAETTVENEVITWADMESAVAEAGLEGEFKTFEDAGAKIWIPTTLLECELTDEDKADGCLGYFMTEDETSAIAVWYMDLEGMSIEDYMAALAEVGATEIEQCTVNGLTCVSYIVTEDDIACVDYVADNGYILEVTCYPYSDEAFQIVIGAVCASIQAA